MVFEALKLRHPRSEELHKPFEQLLAPHLKDPMQLHLPAAAGRCGTLLVDASSRQV